ncbi:MAG: hypothetical protein JXB49_30615 [Bacteroidales bacterium]|nr:hypothetical protein [Bacteroidales bacterium]
MDLLEFISIYRKSGQVIKTVNGCYIQPHGWRSYSYPLTNPVTVTKDLIKSLRWKYLISTILTHSIRKNSVEFVLDTNKYTIDRFPRKTRNRIRMSLNNCIFRRPDIDELISDGLEINRQTLERQRRDDKILSDSTKWIKYISTLYSFSQILILGAFYKNRMVGYLMAYELNGVYNILHAYIDRKDSETTCPMLGLIYTLVNQLIERNGSVRISYGLDSFSPEPELSRFKRNMLFNQIPTTRVYVINPVILFLLRLIIIFNIRIIRRKNIRNQFIRKIIKLYQGYRIIKSK